MFRFIIKHLISYIFVRCFVIFLGYVNFYANIQIGTFFICKNIFQVYIHHSCIENACLTHMKVTGRKRTREGFLRKNIVAVYFFKIVLYSHIFNTHFFSYMISFKHEHLSYLHSYMSSQNL